MQTRPEMIELIAMLTHNDKTVDNAREVFAQSVDAPTQHWGFKDTGLSSPELALLARDMKDAGKTVHFESLEEEESRCVAAAQFAIDNGLDFLIGMAFHPSVATLLAEAKVGYLPTCGGRSGLPRMLHGSIEDIVGDANRIRPQADGVALSLYRWTDGDPGLLGKASSRKSSPLSLSPAQSTAPTAWTRSPTCPRGASQLALPCSTTCSGSGVSPPVWNGCATTSTAADLPHL